MTDRLFEVALAAMCLHMQFFWSNFYALQTELQLFPKSVTII